jgi:5-methylthioadenosine/S-adenosylhomocysteine deaminase
MSLDLLIHNGVVVTVDRDFTVIENGMVGVSGDTIVLVARQSENEPLPEAVRHMDAQGGIVMPGLVNTHTHLPMTLFRGMADDLPLQTWLNEHMFPAEATFITPETARAGTRLACAEMLLSGTTTCCDGYFHEEAVAAAVKESGMRAVLGCGVIDFPAPGVPDPSKNIEHAVRYCEETAGISPLVTPSIFCHSPYTCSRETLTRAKAEAMKAGLLFQIHVAETRTEREQILGEHGKSPVGYLEDILDPSTLLVHCVWVDEKDIEIIARRKAAVSIATESNMKLASGMAPVPELIASKIPMGLGTDGAASNNDLDMFREMDMTAKLHKVRLQDPTTLDARTVLTLATRGGAAAIGLGDVTGSLEAGKQADMVILETNHPRLLPLHSPVSHAVYAARGSDVRDVLVAGRLVVKNRELLSLPVEEVMAEVQGLGARIKK